MTTETLTDHGHTVTIIAGVGQIIIVTDTGYRAVLPMCTGGCADRGAVPCPTRPGERGQHAVSGKTSVSAWLAHSKTHCHNWHVESARVLAAEVLATYRKAGKYRLGAVGVPRGAYMDYESVRSVWA